MGDEFVDDWSKQTVSIKVDADLATAVRLVQERLGIVLTEDDRQGFIGPDASGAMLSVRANNREIPSFLTDEQKAALEDAVGPEATSIYVRHTTVGHEIVAALSDPPFRLMYFAPYADAQSLRRQSGWEDVLRQLRAQGWQVTLMIDGPPVVLEGLLPTGEEFELKCRGDDCVLSIDRTPGGWEDYDLPYANAGVIGPDEAARVLRELHARWLTR